ncbi:MAG: phage tail assembly chaperone [Janthinobacterium lividum]
MSTALGGFNWTPAEFWAATPHDYYAAAEYHARARARMDNR